MFGIIMERLTESLVVVCVALEWDCFSGELKVKNAQERSSAGKGGKVRCDSDEVSKRSG